VHDSRAPLRLLFLAAALGGASPVWSAAAETPSPGAPSPEDPTSPPPGEAPATPEPPATPPSEAAPSGGPPPAPAEPDRRPAEPARDTWIDTGHAFLERRLFAPVVRFDRFFSDERELEAERSRSFLRLRNEVRIDADSPTFNVNLRANLRLPGLNRWLERARLVVTGETDDTVGRLFPDPQDTAPDSTVGTANAELRYGVWQGLLSHVDLGAGVLFRLPPGLFAQTRFRLAVPLDYGFLTRFSDRLFWRTDKGFGTGVALELERPIGPASLARIGGSSELSQESRGVEWRAELAGLRTVGTRIAVLAAAAMEGASDAPVRVDRYRLYTRARRDVWRRWLFFELEPEVAWPWDVARGRYREYAVTLRMEIQFQGNEPPEPLDVPLGPLGPLGPPEPADPPPEPASPR
jgi:hypothetical protein